MKAKFGILIIIIIFPLFSGIASPVKFYSINSKFGISIRETNSICKDNNGFIWASSKTGILRLTNDDYRIYKLPCESANVVSVHLIYVNSKLIAYTHNGQIFQYNTVFDRFDLIINLTNTLKDNQLSLYSLLVDATGTYWFGLNSGLYTYQSKKLSFISKISTESYRMTWLGDHQILFLKKVGIWLFDIHTRKEKCIYEKKHNPFSSIISTFFDKIQNKLWFGTLSDGLFCFDLRTKILTSILNSTIPQQPIRAIEENTDSTILVGFDGQGIWELNKKSLKVLNIYKESVDDPYSLPGNGVYDIFCDNNKRVWVCTNSRGVSFFDQATTLVTQIVHRSNDANSLINNEVNCIIEDRYGKIWFATNNGISSWDVKLNQWKSFYSNKLEQAQVFLTLCEDNQGQIWAGTYSSGLYILDQKTGKELAHYSSGNDSQSVSNFIFSIYKDSQGDIWIGSVSDELTCYSTKEKKFRFYSKEALGSFAELSPKEIFLGCSYGLARINKETGAVKKLLFGFEVKDLTLINEDVWICTSGDGLIKYNYKKGTTEKYTTQSGLPSNYLNSIIRYGDFLWLGTESGLCRFNLKNKTIMTFSTLNALSGFSYNQHSNCVLKNGQLACGTNNGAVFFSPDSINEISTHGKIFFQDFVISGRSIRDLHSLNLKIPVDSLSDIELRYLQNNINMDLIPICSESGSKFSWKLEGFDKNWTPPNENRLLTYTNIPSGIFTLRIKLYNSSLTQVISERMITITVIPPFWMTNWFRLVVFFSVSGIILLYFLYYTNLLKQRHSVEKIRFFTNTAHDIRNSLTLIKAPVEELDKEIDLSESGRYYLNLAVQQARRLSFVVTQLLDFQKVDIGKEQIVLAINDIVKLISNSILMFESFSKSKNIELIFKTDRNTYLTAVDVAKIEKIVENLVSNAVKYSNPGSQVVIDLKCGTDKWELKVTDNGIGISRKAQRQLFKEFHRGDNAINSKIVGSGIGLLLVKNYVKMHGGTIKCESQENMGSTFLVNIPYKKMIESLNKVNDFVDTQLSSNKIGGKNVPVPAEFEINPANDMSVLIVEDNDDLLHFMQKALGSEFNVFTAKNGGLAWDFISKKIPDLIVSDVMMPEMDGFELCKLIKSTYETSHIPIILLTGLSEKTEQLHGLGLGADDYLIKPFDMNLLVQRIKTIIRNRIAVREKALKLIRGNFNEPILSNEHNDKFVKKMLEIAKANISNSEFNKDIFASEMNVSSSLLYKKIKSLTNQSPTDFIKTVRLDYSFELLQTKKYNITEVSELCGFTSVAYFSTVFKKHFGKSPANLTE